MLHIFFLAAM